MNFKSVHPHPKETYNVCVDDHCFCLNTNFLTNDRGPGNGKEVSSIWLSRSMVQWLHDHLLLLDAGSAAIPTTTIKFDDLHTSTEKIKELVKLGYKVSVIQSFRRATFIELVAFNPLDEVAEPYFFRLNIDDLGGVDLQSGDGTDGEII